MTNSSIDKPLSLVIGLGNPDPEYAHTYHNAGILALEFLAKELESHTGAPLTFSRYKDLFTYTEAGSLALVKPLVFMNQSGIAAREAAKKFHATPETIAILHDDSDLRIGEMKIVRGGSSAGHKGIRSVIDHLHSEDFIRIRIGIRPKEESTRKKAGDFVLSPISKNDQEALREIYSKIALLLLETIR